MSKHFELFAVMVLLIYSVGNAVSSKGLLDEVRVTNRNLEFENIINNFTRGDSSMCVIDWARIRGGTVNWKEIQKPKIFFNSISVIQVSEALRKLAASTILIMINNEFDLKKIYKFSKINQSKLPSNVIVIGQGDHTQFSYTISDYLLIVNFSRAEWSNRFYSKKITKLLTNSNKLQIISKSDNGHSHNDTIRYNRINIFVYNLYNLNVRIGAAIVLTVYLVLWFVYETVYYNCIAIRPNRQYRLSPMNIFLIIFAVHHGLPYRFPLKLKLFQKIIFASLLIYVIIIYGVYTQTVINKLFIGCNDSDECIWRESLNQFNYRFVERNTIELYWKEGTVQFVHDRLLMHPPFGNMTTLELFNSYIASGLLWHELNMMSVSSRTKCEAPHLKVIAISDLENLFVYLVGAFTITGIVFLGEIVVFKWQRCKLRWRCVILKKCKV